MYFVYVADPVVRPLPCRLMTEPALWRAVVQTTRRVEPALRAYPVFALDNRHRELGIKCVLRLRSGCSQAAGVPRQVPVRSCTESLPTRRTRGVEVANKILMVEDDRSIGTVLTSCLRGHGYDVTWERTGACAVVRAETSAVDLVLLDLGLPDIEGIEVCRRLRRAQPGCVIVILTARSAEMDVVVGLDSGADDYLVKPVRLAELQARLRAHLRRNEAGSITQEVHRMGDLVIDARRRRVTVAGQELHLRPKEFDLLARLAAEPDVAVRRETLMCDVWDEHWFGSTKTLDVHVATLRRRVAETAAVAGAEVPRIVTIRGHGYRLEFGAQDAEHPRPLGPPPPQQ